MTEQGWHACEDPRAMLEWLLRGVGDRQPVARVSDARPLMSGRKLRLFACACARRAWHLLSDPRSRSAVEVAERHADGLASDRELAAQEEAAQAAAWAARWAAQAPPTISCAAILRDVTGNPFRPVRVQRKWRCADGEIYERCPNGSRLTSEHMPSDDGSRCLACGAVYGHPWLTPQVLDLAHAAYQERQPDGTLDPFRLALLADALEEAGCASEECEGCDGRGTLAYCRRCRGTFNRPGGVACVVCPYSVLDAVPCDRGCGGDGRAPHPILAHLRSPGPHARGCFAIDLLTGRE